MTSALCCNISLTFVYLMCRNESKIYLSCPRNIAAGGIKAESSSCEYILIDHLHFFFCATDTSSMQMSLIRNETR